MYGHLLKARKGRDRGKVSNRGNDLKLMVVNESGLNLSVGVPTGSTKP